MYCVLSHLINLQCSCYCHSNLGEFCEFIVILFNPILIPTSYQGLKIDNLEIRHFVLVHGGGFGAWCWYKSIALLEDSGFKVSAIDLTGSGISSFNTNKVTSIAEYAKPLTGFLEALGDLDKVCTFLFYFKRIFLVIVL